MKEIISSKNTLIKELKKLHKKKYRDEQKQYLIEGFHLIEEAERFHANLSWILFNQRGQKEWKNWLDTQPEEKLILVSDEVLASLSDLPTPQGILAVVEKQEVLAIENLKGKWLLLDNVQDPGNIGTMIRTADAAGLTGVFLGKGTADIYSTKILRAMQGSNFHLPVIQSDLNELISAFKEQQVPVFGTALDSNSLAYTSLKPSESFALIMGNEGQGVSTELLENATVNLHIPMKGQAESLNVAVAAGILLFELIKGK